MAPRVRIASESGRVVVRAERRDDVTVDGDAAVTHAADHVRVDARGAITVRVPEGSDVTIGVRSGRTETRGLLGNVQIVSESGRVEVERADTVDVRTTSSRVDVGEVEGGCCVRTDSGGVEVRSCGTADVSTASGGIQIGEARGEVRAHCVSGRISVGMTRSANVVADTVTGRVDVRFPRGVRVHQIDELPEGTGFLPPAADADCTVLARSISGRVEVSTR